MAGNPNYTSLLTTTLNNYRNVLVDVIFKDRPLSRWLMEKSRTRMLDGGVKIVEQLIYAQGQAGSYSGYDQITINPQGGLTAAEFDWRQLYATIAISGIEEAQNNGKAAMLDLLKAKIMQAEETLKDNVNTMLFGDGTGNSNKEWYGLRALLSGLDDDGVRVGTASIGGIDGATEAYWNSVVKGSSTGAVTAFTPVALNTPYNSASKGNDRIDAIFTTQALYESYEAQLLPSVRRSEAASADAGFDNLLFKGKPIFYDGDCPAGSIFGINSKYLKLVGHSQRWFKNSGFTENAASAHATSGATNITDARYALITAFGNLTISNRKRHFRCVNWAPA
jgi:hypothetical protein